MSTGKLVVETLRKWSVDDPLRPGFDSLLDDDVKFLEVTLSQYLDLAQDIVDGIIPQDEKVVSNTAAHLEEIYQLSGISH